MKTTIQIPDSLFEEARKLAQRDRTTLKALVEQGLRQVIAQRKRSSGFRLRDASFKGEGLNPQRVAASWEEIHSLSYKGRGG